MIGALLRRNLRHHRALLAALCLGLVGIETLISKVVEAFDGGRAFVAVVEQLPPLFRGLIASQLEFLSFASGLAFGFQHPVVLGASLALMVVAGTIPAGERESGLLDLVLARPVPRHRYLLATLGTLALEAVVPPAALLAGVGLGLALTEHPADVTWDRYPVAALGLFTLLLAAGGFALLLGAGAARRGRAAAQAAAVLMGLFLLDVLSGIWGPLEALRPWNPFHYFKPVLMVVRPPAPASGFAILLGVFAACAALAFVRFRRHDL